MQRRNARFPLSTLRRALVLAALAAAARAAPAPGDDDGLVSTWVLHFDGEMRVACVATYRDLLRELPRKTRVLVGVTTAEDARRFRDEIGLTDKPDPRVRFVEAGEWVSGWARDRYVFFAKDGKECLFLPRREGVAPNRLGDLAIARELKRVEPDLEVIEGDLDLEGGNLLFTGNEVIAGPAAVAANVLEGAAEADVRSRIEDVFGRRLVVVADADSPLAREHVDMYIGVAGPKTLLLGDPRAALAALDEGDDPREFGRFKREKQLALAEAYDVIEARLKEEGFEVRRIPILHAEDGVILTWTNAVVETRGKTRRVYMPRYGLKRLDAIAQGVWKDLGWEPVPISAEAVIVLGGGVRCVTNTRRDAVAPGEEVEDGGAGEGAEQDDDEAGAQKGG
ncbi:MAG TPA: agmatine deiminase family protein [Planctomycetota bacterium]|nr:agmatine deiminase family protein [Planctomycetota bacterium]